jgi:ArsR family transcriptional regulator, arsenate/arsenite/antimonite-responsive transcriptional repressor
LSTHTTLGAKPRNGRASGRAPATRKSSPAPADESAIKEMCSVFKMLSDPSRLKILRALAQNGQMHVSALCDLLRGQSQPAVSHHLSLMRHTKLVCCDRQGKHNFYRLDPARFGEMIEQLFGEMGNGAKQILFEDFALSLKRK